MTIAEKIAHLKGLAEGLDIASETSKEAKLLTAMLDVLSDLGDELDEVVDSVDLNSEELDELSDEVMALEEDYYGEDDGTWPYDEDEDDDFEDEDDDVFYVVECPECGAKMELDEDTLLAGNIRCDSCGQLFSLEVLDDGEEADEGDFQDDEEEPF